MDLNARIIEVIEALHTVLDSLFNVPATEVISKIIKCIVSRKIQQKQCAELSVN